MSPSTTTYYDATASIYDQLHGGDQDQEHIRALEKSWPLLKGLAIESVLDVGCGTGRSLQWFSSQQVSLRLLGVDPSRGLLEFAKKKLPKAALCQATGEALPFADNSVDVVIATGIMHHIEKPAVVITEMFRVARRAVVISDHNNFAFGSIAVRNIRMLLYLLGVLKPATYIKQGFSSRGYTYDDGWWYPYSLFNNHNDIARFSDQFYIIPTSPVNTQRMTNIIFSQSHFAVCAMKSSDRWDSDNMEHLLTDTKND